MEEITHKQHKKKQNATMLFVGKAKKKQAENKIKMNAYFKYLVYQIAVVQIKTI